MKLRWTDTRHPSAGRIERRLWRFVYCCLSWIVFRGYRVHPVFWRLFDFWVSLEWYTEPYAIRRALP